jgi:hypothetical protein
MSVDLTIKKAGLRQQTPEEAYGEAKLEVSEAAGAQADGGGGEPPIASREDQSAIQGYLRNQSILVSKLKECSVDNYHMRTNLESEDIGYDVVLVSRMPTDPDQLIEFKLAMREEGVGDVLGHLREYVSGAVSYMRTAHRPVHMIFVVIASGFYPRDAKPSIPSEALQSTLEFNLPVTILLINELDLRRLDCWGINRLLAYSAPTVRVITDRDLYD